MRRVKSLVARWEDGLTSDFAEGLLRCTVLVFQRDNVVHELALGKFKILNFIFKFFYEIPTLIGSEINKSRFRIKRISASLRPASWLSLCRALTMKEDVVGQKNLRFQNLNLKLMMND